MSNYPYEKAPAFFRAMSPELFFEAEAADGNLITLLTSSEDVNAELDAILSQQQSD